MSKTTELNPLYPMKVSARDRAIYQAVKIDGKQQRAVAIEFKLSQPRVSAIIKRVTLWLSQGDPPGLGELYRRDRLRVVSRLHRMRLEQLFVETREAWLKSDQPKHTLRETVVKGEVIPLKTVHTRDRDWRLEREMHTLMKSMLAFEGFDELGRVDESCEGRVYEEPMRTPVDAYREVKRRTILGGFDTPGDEGIPGMWEKELEQRNREVGKGVGNAECGLRSERKVEAKSCAGEAKSCAGEATAWEGEAPAEPKAERQLGEPSLSSVLRGEGRGEGPELREDSAISEDPTSNEYVEINQDSRANIPPKTENTPEILSDRNEKKATEVLSRKSPDSAQVPQQQAITNSTPAEKVLSNNPPKVPRYRLMGTAAEMAVSKNYDEFFSPEERAYRALEKAKAEQRKRMESRAPHQPLTPTLSPEYRGEGAGLRAPQPAYAPSPQLPIARPPR